MRKVLVIMLLAGAGCQGYGYQSEPGGYSLYRSRTYNPPSTIRHYEDVPDTSRRPLHRGDPESTDLFETYTTFKP
jgi:hypothetical protein